MSWNPGWRSYSPSFKGPTPFRGPSRGAGGRGDRELAMINAASNHSGGNQAPSFLSGFLNVPWTGNVSTDRSVSAMGAGTASGAVISGNALVVVGNGADQTVQWGLAEPNALGRTAGEAFTIEAWVYWTTLHNSTGPCIFAQWFIGAPTFQEQHIFGFYGNAGAVGHNGVGPIGAGRVTVNTWTHVAMVRPAGASVSASFYIGGVLTGTKAIFDGNAAGGYVKTGVAGSNVATNCKVGSLRLTKSELYTANFTPPANPMT